MSNSRISAKSALGYKSANRDRRKIFHIKQKKARDALKREEKFRRKKNEDKNPKLRAERLSKNVPHTIESKRAWDEAEGDEEDMLGLAVDLERLSKKRRTEELEGQDTEDKELPGISDGGYDDSRAAEEDLDLHEGEESEADSMLEDDDAEGWEDSREADEMEDGADGDQKQQTTRTKSAANRATSPTGSTASTRFDLTPEALFNKFPSLLEPPSEPKILVTTSLNGNLHDQAQLLASLFPNSTYVRRSAHRFSHKYSVREISSFASNRGFTTLLVLNEDQKKPCGLDIVHLPLGPMFHFSMTNWVEGKKLAGHGNPTNHHPELILNNFRTPLGLLTAHLFRTMFPPRPEHQGRQVITLHNQRDYIFVRRHRYVFRDKRQTEKSVTGTDGLPVKGVEEIRAGLQELGPRFTLRLRRVDKGIQRKSGQEWEWKAKTDKMRTKFQL